jgi:two-component system chemotaxis sensor kinase CheA
MTSLSAKIREQIISSFRAELAEHLQTLNNGLLAIEQGAIAGDERVETLRSIFRAAHSLKGAARAVGITIVEQMSHSLESVLDALQKGTLQPSQEMFNAAYQTIDAIQLVQEAYEKGETTPPFQATQAIFALEALLHKEPEPAEKVESKSEAKVESGNGKHPRKTDPAAHAEERMKKTFDHVLESKQDAERTSAEKAPAEKAPVEAKTEAAPEAKPEPEALTAAQQQQLVEERRKNPDRRVQTDMETVRVKVSRLDTLMEYLNELLIIKIRSQQRLEQVKNVKEKIVYLEKEWQSARGAYAHRTHNQSSETGKVISKDERKLLNYISIAQEQVHNSNHDINIVELELEVKSLRMLPLGTITAPFARMVRDIALEHSKEVIFDIHGADTEMDKHILEQIKDPLIHLLRNAVDHGIELPAQRIAAGKPSAGRITLNAEQMGRDVVIKVTDDGAGINMDRLRRAAAKLGIDPSTMSDTAVQQYIFEAGVSTNTTVTDISGRGVGLDIVRKNMEELGGTCEVVSEQGKGATFTLTIPVRVTGSRGLMVKTSGQAFAIPINSVDYILSTKQKNITLLEGRDVIYHNNQPIALLWLCDTLDLPRTASFMGDMELPVVILKSGDHRIAFVVDELAGEQEIVVKGLGDQLTRIAGLAGATILGTGEVVLILNAKDLISMAMRGGYTNAMQTPVAADSKPARPMRRILVVDDSITTRTLEKNILEAAGYSVDLATDGQEALNLVSAGNNNPDIIISDVSMPRVGGLELTRRIKNNPQTTQIPIILVSSMDSSQDKQLGMEAGADAYISKGGFDQNNLLETIEMIVTQKG